MVGGELEAETSYLEKDLMSLKRNLIFINIGLREPSSLTLE